MDKQRGSALLAELRPEFLVCICTNGNPVPFAPPRIRRPMAPTHESQGLGGRIPFGVGLFGVVRVTAS
jgi:hypothetical protein